MRFSAFALLALLLLSGCITRELQIDPSADLGRVKTIFVQQRLGDDHRVDQFIVTELTSLGFQVTSGPSTMQPDRVDVVVSYADRWEWDFKNYLISLAINVRDGNTDRMLASASYYRPSIVSRTPAQMLHEMLPTLFKVRKVRPKPVPAPAPADDLRKEKPHHLQ